MEATYDSPAHDPVFFFLAHGRHRKRNILFKYARWSKKRILTRESTYDNNVMGIVPDRACLVPEYLHTCLLGFNLSGWASDAQPPSMRKTTVEAHSIPLPLLSTQQAIIAEIEAEQALVNANRELIDRFEKKIQDTLARIWGDAEPDTAA